MKRPPVARSVPSRLLFTSLTLFLLSTLPAHAWRGHSWEEWRKQTGETKPNSTTPQAGRADLVPLLDSDTPGAPRIDTIKGWEQKRDRILGTMQELMGHPGADVKLFPPEAEILGTETMNGRDLPGREYERLHLRIRSESDDWIPAYLLIPAKAVRNGGAMIVIHQTVVQGKEEPCGIETRAKIFNGLDLAVQLVREGYVCIVPDMIGFGERLGPNAEPYDSAGEFYKRNPHWSFFGKMAWDVQRIVDYLLTRPEVEPNRIGIIGHSHGAYASILTAAMEPRISAVVASCGFTTLRNDPAPNRWNELTPLLPRLGFYTDDIKSAPIDWQEIIATLAPRPLFYWIGADDMNFQHTENLPDIFAELQGVYGLYGRAGEAMLVREPGPHGFPDRIRTQARLWLGWHLPRSASASRQPVTAYIKGKTPDPMRTKFRDLEELITYDLGDRNNRAPLASRLSKTRHMDGFTSSVLAFETRRDEWTSGTLLMPPGDAPKPGVLVFHQTVPEGQREPLGLAGRPSMHLARELAARGYAVMTFDSICAGSRITASGAFDTRDQYKSDPDISALGRMIADGRAALTALSQQKDVDPTRIAVAGHSLGAEEALFVAAFDDRVKACVASCGFAPFAAEADPQRWARDHWFSYMPRLRVDFRAGRLPAWDFDDVIKLVAPRGYFNFQAADDDIFPQGAAIDPLIKKAAETWKLYGAEDRVQSLVLPGKHDFPDEARERAWTWLDKMMKN